jgi:histidinol-phosphate phosphatase family protein
MNRAVFLDRDGVINEKAPEGAYITTWEEMRFLPGVELAILLFHRAGFRVIIITNQRCVAKGLTTVENLEALHLRMCAAFAGNGAVIDAVYYCPHQENPPCRCRKPAPGMLLDAARDHDIDLAHSWMIGDSEADVLAGKNAGCQTARIASNPERGGNADLLAPSLLDAARQILALAETDSAGLSVTQSKSGLIS